MRKTFRMKPIPKIHDFHQNRKIRNSGFFRQPPLVVHQRSIIPKFRRTRVYEKLPWHPLNDSMTSICGKIELVNSGNEFKEMLKYVFVEFISNCITIILSCFYEHSCSIKNSALIEFNF